jgi:hypothetical protein
MKFAELKRLFIKKSQKRRFSGILLRCRLEVRRSPRLNFAQSGVIYHRIWPWGAPTAEDALTKYQIILHQFFGHNKEIGSCSDSCQFFGF